MKREAALPLSAAAAAASVLLYAFLIRPWHLRWGADEKEANRILPGDDFVIDPKGEATHAVTINAPVEEVWAWLVQIGQNKAGFYSYSWLENLFGCRLRNADRILPQFQHLRVGDKVWLHPKVPPLPVLICEPNKALVLGSNFAHPGTWGFFLEKRGANSTRLVIRGRERWRKSLLYWLYYRLLFEPAHFVMERRMLLGIKGRAERFARQHSKGTSDLRVREDQPLFATAGPWTD